MRWGGRLPTPEVGRAARIDVETMVTGRGGVAEWLRQGPAKPCTRVRFPAPPPISDLVKSQVTHCFCRPDSVRQNPWLATNIRRFAHRLITF
jgi:hypothetical protein